MGGNPRAVTSDRNDVTCQRWREAISARVDGEGPGIDARLLAAHLARCAGCRQFRADAEQSVRAVRVRPVEAMPDLARRVVKLNAVADRASRWGPVRGTLAIVALQVIGLSLPALVMGDAASTSAHGARHLGAFSVAYGVGLLVVAVRPARARTMLPVAQVLAGALLIGAIIDIVDGNAPFIGEIVHLPELASVVLVWLLAIPAPQRRPGAQSSDGNLRLVDDPPAPEADDGREAGL